MSEEEDWRSEQVFVKKGVRSDGVSWTTLKCKDRETEGHELKT